MSRESMLISKDQFIKAYNKYPPKKWIRFAFKYFSKSTEAQNLKPSKTIAWILLSLFIVGFVGTILKLPRAVIGIATISFAGLLTVLVLFLLAAVLTNNKRIKKIAKELKVTLQQYNDLAEKYGDEVK